MRRIMLAFTVLACSLQAGTAAAHAFLEHATPAAGEAVTAPPASITLDFSEEIQPKGSTVTLQDASGAAVPLAISTPTTTSLVGTLVKPLAPGDYTVQWQAMCAYSHATHGHYTFTVGGAP